MIGFSEGFHDAGIAVVHKNTISYAAHSERYSKKKHDKRLDLTAVTMARGINIHDDVVAFYENPLLKRTRQLYAGQKAWRRDRELSLQPNVYFQHHKSHAAAAFQTSNFEHAACVVVDSLSLIHI